MAKRRSDASKYGMANAQTRRFALRCPNCPTYGDSEFEVGHLKKRLRIKVLSYLSYLSHLIPSRARAEHAQRCRRTCGENSYRFRKEVGQVGQVGQPIDIIDIFRTVPPYFSFF